MAKRGRKRSSLPKPVELELDGLRDTARRRFQLRTEVALRGVLNSFHTLGSAVGEILEIRRQRLPVSRSSAEIPQTIYALNDELLASLGRTERRIKDRRHGQHRDVWSTP